MTTAENPLPNEPPDAPRGAGNELREARIKAGLSVQDVANRLRLDTDTIGYLEDEIYERLPAPAFVRGYLRNYAALLGVPPDPFVQAFNRRGLPAPPLRADIAQNQPVTANRMPLRIAISGILLCAVILTAVQLFGQNSELEGTNTAFVDPSEPSPSAEAEPLAAGDLAAPEQPSTSVPKVAAELAERPTSSSTPGLPSAGKEPFTLSENTSVGLPPEIQTPRINAQAALLSSPPLPDGKPASGARASADAATASSGDPMTEALPPVVEGEARANSAAPAQDHLTMRFAHDSWVEIYDQGGARLHYNLMKEGEMLTLSGAAPFRVLLGYAKDVNIEYNGLPFDHRSFIHPQGLARFSLGKPSRASAGGNDTEAIVPTSGNAGSTAQPAAVTGP
nr:helix-turn-helix domain-containing protein [Gammaproteobacteria bacterium]